MKKILAALLVTTSIANAQQIMPPVPSNLYGTWKIEVISTQMKPVPSVTIESTKGSASLFWGDNACYIRSRVKDTENSYNASCIKFPNPYKFVETVVTFDIPDENYNDMHFTAQGIESVDVWTRKISEGLNQRKFTE